MEGAGARLHGQQPEHLLDLGEGSSQVYNTGQRPPVDDSRLLQSYDIDDGDKDDFVGGTAAAARGPPLSQSRGPPATTSTFEPPYLNTGDRTYSQTSDLQNYSRYSDMDDFPEEESSAGRYHHGVAASDDNIPGGGVQVVGAGHSRNRNSILSMGGGFMGKAKNMLGMGPNYSEMDLPLTEHGARVDTFATDDTAGPREKKGFSPGDFKFGIGRRKTDPSTLGPRIIQLNNSPVNAANRWVDNHVSTAKYNVATFLPKFLYEQFSKYANLFFLFTAILQQIPNVSPTNRYTTIVPLVIVLMVSATKELVEDFKRKNSDKTLNHSKARVLQGSDFGDTKWINVAVGDIVRVESEEPFPADLVLLASSEPEGLCYIETANLDGETNLKIKQAIPETAHLVSPNELGRLTGRVRSEQPNSSLYTYEATLTMRVGGGEKELPLTPDQLLLRGATLRNTPWIHGLVVFTGHETKLMRNATATPIKRTDVERMLNKQILMLVAILLILSAISTIGDLIVRSTAGTKLSYLYYGSFNAASQFFLDIFTYWVLYSNLVPISLFVTIELVKYYQAFLINNDLDIYYAETDTAAICRTSSLVEELGQIEYIFSDKTGTLTCNVMQFRQCSIGGIQYAETVPEDRRAVGDNDTNGLYDFNKLRLNLVEHSSRSAIHHFLAMLATCHTVIPERKNEKSEIKYQAASPDEGALVEGAAMLGYKFVARKPRSVIVQIGGQEFEYELLAVCEFNSTRKRMSTIFRCPDGKIRIYCKGADTVILERLAQDNPVVDVTLQHLEDYATEGLRTLCLAMREVPEQEYREWQQIFDKAATTVGGNRAEELDKAAEIIEHGFFLLGATAIEDKLQDGVPDTIHTLQTAGIKVWVLTGDRQETAINIGMSCKLISEDMTLLIVNEDNSTATRDNLSKKLDAVRNQTTAGTEVESLALVIDGKSLTFALEREMEKLFLDLAVSCKAVICCRVSPLQKALVVKLVKRHLKALLLAIGDGANDVSMIQAAHVGVGISGVEGLQAARSADVAIGQFRYLRKLLLVHGAWSYQRISRVILYSFYKNIAMFMTQFWYSFQNAFSGQVIFESWTLSFYNVLFTVLPPFAMGIFDQFISARLLDRYPQLYQLGQKGTFFRMHSFFSWVGNGFYHSILAYIFSSYFFYDDLVLSNGKMGGHWLWGTSLYTAVLGVVLGKAALVTNVWTKYTVLAIPGSMIIWLAFIPVYATAAPRIGSGFSTELRGIPAVMFSSPVFYAMVLLLPPLCLVRDFAWKYAKRMYYPQTYHHVQEIQKYNVQDYRPRMEQFQKAVRKVRQVQRMRKQRGYAFSAGDDGGQQMRVLNAYDTTRERGSILASVAGPGHANEIVRSAAPIQSIFAGLVRCERLTETNSCPPTRSCTRLEMMLWKSRGSRPTTRSGRGRIYSIIDESKRGSDKSAQQDGLPPNSEDDLPLPETQSVRSLPFEQDQQSTDSPPITPRWPEAQETNQSQEQVGTPGQSNKNGRFSLMKLRHASDPQLFKSYAAASASPPPSLPTPTIITTSPTTQSFDQPSKQKPKRKLFGRAPGSDTHNAPKDRKKHPLREASSSLQNLSFETPSADINGQNVTFEEPYRPSVGQRGGAPPAYGDDANSTLAIPLTRLSESSRSEGSLGDHGIYAQTTTTHTISTTTTFFRLPRRKRDKGPLFPLPAKLSPSNSNMSSAARTPRASTSGRTSISPVRGQIVAVPTDPNQPAQEQPSPFPSPTHSTIALTNAPQGSPGRAIFRKESSMSQRSGASTPSLQVPPPRTGRRGRSSTMGSLGKSVDQDLNDSPPQLTPSGRNSTSTGGRKSFGDIFSLSHRLRQNSEPPPRNGSGLPGTPGSTGSKATSLQISRELTYPRRGDEDTPATYLAKLEAAVPRGYMATILCKGSDEFSKTCLRKYMRGFSYFVDSIDMAIRKMLMEVELPKETQQIDRLLQGFADRYCECNPGIFVSVDEAYFVAFSILLLHSDTHNKNNKRKMQKQDYVKNTQDQVEVSNDILECFYDNVSYTPFIHFEDEVAINSHRLTVPKPRKSLFRTPSTESLRGPVDPYTLILDNKLDVLRPSLKDVMDTEDTYNWLGTSLELDVASLHNGFFRSGIIQIVSARSRPDAFLTQATISNPAEAQAGLVDIKAAKVGLLWRKDPKKKKTKSPWQEWGAILTSSQLYFFRDVGWIKRLMFQHESHQKSSPNTGIVLFKPPLSSFEPDALMSMDDAVAFLDSSYKKHKHAFVFIKHGGFEEVFLANDEADMNDWIAKLNYAATFRTAGVRMRGHIGQVYEGQQRPVTQPNLLDPAENVTPLDETEPNSYATDARLLEQIINYRRQIMEDKIKEATEKLALAQKELDSLLRNARHLQVLTPIQARTREALILAAGRMSAKLKWIRVEMARTKCHRDILRLDLDEGAVEVAVIEAPPLTPTLQKTSPLRSDRPSLTSVDLRTCDTLTTPKSPVLSQKPGSDPPSVTEKMKGSDGSSRPLSNVTSRASGHKSVNSLEVPASVENNSASSSREAIHLVASNPGSHSLAHQVSIISSHHRLSDSDSRLISPTLDLDNGEKQVLREAGLLSADGTSPSGKRPGTSGSDRDRVGSISLPDGTPRDRGSVRRSLQRSLREPQHVPHLQHHHRGKKGRDSNSSAAFTEDGKSVSGEGDGLTRGTGSFTVHGKKASVVTLGSEWQSMSNEDRLRLRKLAQKDDTKEEAVIEDGTASTVSAPNAVADTRSRTNSTTTAATEQQEEAETSEVSKEVIEGSGNTDDFHGTFYSIAGAEAQSSIADIPGVNWSGPSFWSHGLNGGPSLQA